MRHILDSPARQVTAARGGAIIAASSSRLRAVSNDADAAELHIQLPAAIDIDNSFVGSVAGDVAGEVAVAVDVAIADGVADVVARCPPNTKLLLPNCRAFPPVAADTIAVPVPIPIPIDPLREIIMGVENNNKNHNNEKRDHQHQHRQHV